MDYEISAYNENNLLEIERYLNMNGTSRQSVHGKNNGLQQRPFDCFQDLTNRSIASKLEKRNQRERKRVKCVNKEFDNLRQLILDSAFFREKINNSSSFDFSKLYGADINDLFFTNLKHQNKENINNLSTDRVKRVSKLRTLQLAIEYINYLSDILSNQQKIETQEQQPQHQLNNLSNSSSTFQQTPNMSQDVTNQLGNDLKQSQIKYQNSFEEFDDLNLDDMICFERSQSFIETSTLETENFDVDQLNFDETLIINFYAN